MKGQKRSRTKKIVSVMVALVLLCTTLLGNTTAWADFSQNIINELFGSTYKATLLKYEEGTKTPLEGAEFALYEKRQDGRYYRVGTYLTDEEGKIEVIDLHAGEFYFLETAAPYGYEFDENNSCYDFILTQENNEATLTAYNSKRLSDLTITKKVKGDKADKDKEFIFTVEIGGRDNESEYSYTVDGVDRGSIRSGETISLKHGQTARITGIPIGTFYEVLEEESAGYIASSVGHAGNIPADGATVAYTNTYRPDTQEHGKLSIEKKVEGEGADLAKEFTFTVNFGTGEDRGEYPYTIDGEDKGVIRNGDTLTLTHGQTAVIDQLPTGIRYDVVEEDYTADNYGTTSVGASGTIEGGITKEATFTNTYNAPEVKTGQLTVEKIVQGPADNPDQTYHFTVTIGDQVHNLELRNGERYSFTDIPYGTHFEVEEDNYLSQGVITSSTNSSGTVVEEEIVSTFTNTYEEEKTGQLVVHKTVTGEGKDDSKLFHFVVTIGGVQHEIDLAHDQSYVFNNIPYGTTYSVVEGNYTADGYLTESTGAFGTIYQTVHRAEFTNQKTDIPQQTGRLTLKKEVKGEGSDKNKDFNFHVLIGENGGIINETVTLKDGETKVYENLPVGTYYVITEEEYFQDGYVTDSVYGTGTVTPGNIQAVFTNTCEDEKSQTGKLTVVKELAGEEASSDQKFEITVTIGGQTHTVTLAGGESYTFTDIPVDTWYTVVERNYYDQGYITLTTGGVGHIVAGGNTATVKNTKIEKPTGDLILTKKVTAQDEESGILRDKIFKFTVTFQNGDDIATEIVELKDGEIKKWEKLPVGTVYHILEDDYYSDGFITSTTGTMGTIHGGDNQAVVTNRYEGDRLGEISLTKRVENSGDYNKEFVFTVYFEGDASYPYTIDGENQGTIRNGDTITLRHGQVAQITGIPEGTAYSIRENDYYEDGYIGSVTGGAGQITSGKQEAVWTNTGIEDTFVTIEGEKTWEHGANPQVQWPSRITVRLMASGTVYASQVVRAEDNWQYSFTVPKYEADGVTEIIYTIEEAPVENYEGTVEGWNITNTYNPGGSTGIRPEVEKIVSGDRPDTDSEFTFELTPITQGAPMPDGTTGTAAQVQITGAGKVSFDEIRYNEPGTWEYEVREIAGSEEGYIYDTAVYHMVVEVIRTDGVLAAQVTYDTGGQSANALVFTNRYETPPQATGSLVVTKTVAGEGADLNKEFTFHVTIGDRNETFTLKNGEEKRFTDIPVGTVYSVREDGAAGYVTTTVNADGTIPNGEAHAAFTNTYTGGESGTGDLVVEKTVKGVGADHEKSFEFTIKVGNMNYSVSLKDGESYTLTGLPVGTVYEVTEADYTQEGYETSSVGSTGTITRDQARAVYTNTYDPSDPAKEPGSLVVRKTVTGEGADRDKAFGFQVTIGGDVYSFTLKDGEERHFNNIPAGTLYEVQEADYTAEGYTTTADNARGIILENDTREVIVVNHKGEIPPSPVGSLTVTKTVAGEGGDQNKDFQFTVTIGEDRVETFTLKHGESKTFSDIPVGTAYRVVEDNYESEGYVTTSTESSGQVTAEGVTSAFTNTYDTTEKFKLTILKKVTGAGASSHRKFRFRVVIGSDTYEIDLKDGESRIFNDIPKGTSYLVEEEDYTSLGYVTSYENQRGTFQEKDITVTVTNTWEENEEKGSLTVKKVVTGENGDKNEKFTFHVTIGDRTEEFTLKHDEEKVFTDLPVGTAYSVREDVAVGYSTSTENSSGTITREGVTCTVTNTAGTSTGKGTLTVTKTVAGSSGDKTKQFNFQAKIGEVTYKFSLKDGERKTFTGIADGTAYTVTEDNYASEGYTTSSSGASGTITSQGATAAFTNTKGGNSGSGTPGGGSSGGGNGSGSGSGTASGAKTGDTTPITLWILLLIGALSCTALLVWQKKKEK